MSNQFVPCGEWLSGTALGSISLFRCVQDTYCPSCAEIARLRDQYDETWTKLHNAKVEIARLRADLEAYEKIIGDDEWWEEVSLSPYDGDVRQAIRDQIDAAR
jgi:hypothetical protein